VKKPDAPVTARDVAALAGVGLSTVSNVLNRPEVVAADTLRRVLQAIDELGYIRNDTARSLRLGRSRAVGLVMSETTTPFFDELIRSATRTLADRGYAALVGNSTQDRFVERGLLSLFEAQRVRGLLIAPVTGTPQNLDGLARRGLPVVSVDVPTPEAEHCSVAVNDALGGRLVIDHLADLGRRRIAIVRGPIDFPQVTERIRGAREAAAVNEVDLRVITTSTYYGDAGGEAVAAILAEPESERPDAVFAVNDPLAMGILAALMDAGLTVPRDIPVVGYDDVALALLGRMPLTTVRQPVQELGRRAALLLIDEMEGDDQHQHQAVLFEPELVIRASTVIS
jgi:LacI family transcriptional regulator